MILEKIPSRDSWENWQRGAINSSSCSDAWISERLEILMVLKQCPLISSFLNFPNLVVTSKTTSSCLGESWQSASLAYSKNASLDNKAGTIVERRFWLRLSFLVLADPGKQERIVTSWLLLSCVFSSSTTSSLSRVSKHLASTPEISFSPRLSFFSLQLVLDTDSKILLREVCQ